MDLLNIGTVAFDSIKTPFAKADKILGGSATYFSLAASYFCAPGIVAIVGEDFKATDEKIFKNKKIGTAGIEKAKGKTFAWGGEYSFDLNSRKTLFTHLNVLENFKPKLPPSYKNAEYIFLGNIHPTLQKDVLRQIKKPKFVGLDTMNFWIEKNPRELAAVLKLADVLIINDAEARQLSKEHNIMMAAKKILGIMSHRTPTLNPSPKGGGKILIIKRGEYGLLMFQKNLIFNLPGYPLEDVVDPTGAGDSFAGGFMGYLTKSDNIDWDNLKKACVAGSVMASFCVEKMGTKGLGNLKDKDITTRLKEFKQLTGF